MILAFQHGEIIILWLIDKNNSNFEQIVESQQKYNMIIEFSIFLKSTIWCFIKYLWFIVFFLAFNEDTTIGIFLSAIFLVIKMLSDSVCFQTPDKEYILLI